MTSFLVSLVSPDKLLFAEQVDQVDLPGAEGEFGVLSGHAPIVSLLRAGIVTTFTGRSRERFVVLGGVAEFSNETLTILAESAARVDEFDVAGLREKIGEMQDDIKAIAAGQELDKAIARLDHFKGVYNSLTLRTAL
jgi:F-type H+-transporting ATPase subunit epsilon